MSTDTDLRPIGTADAEQRLLLDRTVANLTLEQVVRMGALTAADSQRAAARRVLAHRVTGSGVSEWLSIRYVRWSDVFGLPRPPDLPGGGRLDQPYAFLDHAHSALAGYLAGVAAVFDAGIAVAAPGGDLPDLLAGPWRRTCPPAAIDEDTVYGPHSRETQAVLDSAVALSPESAGRMRLARAAIPRTDWDTALRTVDDAASDWGTPFRARCLRHEAHDVVAGPDTDLVDAVWGAAAAATFRGRLPDEVDGLLTGPYRAA
jgi:hypothetical protein